LQTISNPLTLFPSIEIAPKEKQKSERGVLMKMTVRRTQVSGFVDFADQGVQATNRGHPADPMQNEFCNSVLGSWK